MIRSVHPSGNRAALRHTRRHWPLPSGSNAVCQVASWNIQNAYICYALTPPGTSRAARKSLALAAEAVIAADALDSAAHVPTRSERRLHASMRAPSFAVRASCSGFCSSRQTNPTHMRERARASVGRRPGLILEGYRTMGRVSSTSRSRLHGTHHARLVGPERAPEPPLGLTRPR